LIEKKGKRFLWLILLGGVGGIWYLAANAWGKLLGATDVQFNFENCIPFVPNAIFAYFLIFPFLLTPVFLVKKYNDFISIAVCYAALIFASVVIFFQFPTTMTRPGLPADEFMGWLFSIVRTIDGPNNLFPSLHVSSVTYVAFVNGHFCPKARWLSWLCATVISISTLLVKQHALADVLGGIVFGAAAFILLWLLREKKE